jgi:hypothetical protein
VSQQPTQYGDCLGCKTSLQYLGVENFMVGGSSGVAKLIFGQLAEMNEQHLQLYVFICPNCRRIELRAPEQK